MKTVWIVGGGDIDNDWLKDTLSDIKTEDIIIAADKGEEYLSSIGITPDIFIGDLDSIDSEEYNRISNDKKLNINIHPIRKDETDMRLSILEAIKHNPDRICILGGMGGRQDHFLGNVYLLAEALECGFDAYLLDKANKISVLRAGSYSFSYAERYGRFFSLLPFGGDACIESMTGFSYNVSSPLYLKPYATIGISNEIVENIANIIIKEGWVLMIESSDKC